MVQVGIDVFIPRRKYQVQPYLIHPYCFELVILLPSHIKITSFISTYRIILLSQAKFTQTSGPCKWFRNLLLFKRQPQKMIKYTQIIRQLLLAKCLSVFELFVGLALKGLSK